MYDCGFKYPLKSLLSDSMAEEFHQGAVCGGSWWNSSSRNLFGPCSLASNLNPWQTSPDHLLSSDDHDSAGSASDGGGGGSRGGSVLVQNVQTNPSGGGWINQDLLRDAGTSVENYSDILQETAAAQDSAMNYAAHHQQSFPNSSAAFSVNSSLFQTLFDTDQSQHSLLHNQAMNYPNYQANSAEFLPGLLDQIPPPPMFAKQQLVNHLPLWGSTTAAAATLSDVRGNFLPTTQPQFHSSAVNKHNFPSLNSKRQNEAARTGPTVAKKASTEPTPKRPRIETPSPLPTFKVRKEKLGDRITALQQLVSPFGKTDTASVLHEAIEYIKFLHDQVNALCTPYLKNGSLQAPLQCQQASNNNHNDQQGHGQDLRSGGLCLVPISSTFPVADASTDFWSPSFVGTFKL